MSAPASARAIGLALPFKNSEVLTALGAAIVVYILGTMIFNRTFGIDYRRMR